jgi:hypothetical protein
MRVEMPDEPGQHPGDDIGFLVQQFECRRIDVFQIQGDVERRMDFRARAMRDVEKPF